MTNFTYSPKSTWNSMIARCKRQKGYINCDVCEEWKSDYKSFEKWYFENLYYCGGQKLELDKDLFSNGSKIYSPETCCFLPKIINVSLAFKKSKIDGLPPGVHRSQSGKYYAMIHVGDRHLSKTFETVDEASNFYYENKKRHLKELAEYYKKYLPEKIFLRLIDC